MNYRIKSSMVLSNQNSNDILNYIESIKSNILNDGNSIRLAQKVNNISEDIYEYVNFDESQYTHSGIPEEENIKVIVDISLLDEQDCLNLQNFLDIKHSSSLNVGDYMCVDYTN